MKTSYLKLKAPKYLIILVIINIIFLLNSYSQKNSMLGYIKVGYLFTPPNTADLGFSLNGVARGSDDNQIVKRVIYGFGFKAFMPYKNNFSLDVIWVFKIFSIQG
jgi:hypothetical protein